MEQGKRKRMKNNSFVHWVPMAAGSMEIPETSEEGYKIEK